MQATFTAEEQQEIDRLRAKYGGVRDAQAVAADGDESSCVSCSVGSGTASSRQAEAPSASGRPGSNVEASICAYCQGTGTLVEIYNHRRLESFCKECDGRGVRVFKNGVEVQPPSGGSAAIIGGGGGPLTSSGAAGPAGVVALHSVGARAAGSAGSDDEEPREERIAALQRDVQRIAAKTASYAKERLDALALLQQLHTASTSTAADPGARDDAVRELVAQLDLQLDRLELARRKKQAALDRLRGGGAGGGGGVTLAEIIANEAPRD